MAAPVMLREKEKRFELSVRDVAGELGISPTKVYHQLEAGIIPGRRVGRKKGRWSILRSEFERWQKEGPAREAPAAPAFDLSMLLGAELTFEVTVKIVGAGASGIQVNPRRIG